MTLDARREQFIWSERYRPRTLQDCILPATLKAGLQKAVETGGVPNMLFYGPSGTGKTTTAKAICEELKADWYLLNGSLHGQIDKVRVDIADYASSVSLLGGRRYVIFDEADYLTPLTQPALRSFMEEYAGNCGFIFTCNHVERMIEAIRSRCANINFNISKDEKPVLITEFYYRVIAILDAENLEYDKEAVGTLIAKHFPDLRRVLNELQRYSTRGRIDSGILAKTTETDLDVLIPLMKDKNFTKVRAWLAETTPDTHSLLREFDRHANRFFEPSSIPRLITLLNECDFRAAFCADPEVNLAAHLVAVMASCVFK